LLFHSQSFVLLFLPVTLFAYYRLAARPALREYWLIAASLFFYGWWDVRFLPLMLGQTVISWLLSQLYFRTGRRSLLHLAVVINLATLGLFKYLDFAISVLEDLSGLSFPKAGLILPIGISFYTFQIISYLVDVMRGEAPAYGLRRFVLFIVLFPHLVAGPVVRHNEIIGQFDLDPLRPGMAERLARGLGLFVLAMAVKVLVADRLAVDVDMVFASAAVSLPSLLDAWRGMLGFAFQIFFDFSAYTEMAIGVALMFGLRLPRNFDQPYRSASIQDFWRRWHMSLSRFLRDYVYIPLGGSRRGTARYILASIATMGLCGLWHGAGWTFVLWGLGHGAALIACRFWRNSGLRLPTLAGWLLTFIFAVVMFGLFRAPDLTTAGRLFSGALGANGMGEPWEEEYVVLLAIAAVLALWPQNGEDFVKIWLRPWRTAGAGLAVAAVFLVLEVGKGQPANFIYFQF
jgi:D-alanyl-lipoteichoic acid acyltransferase DltB (MBOAT superfamily)